MPAAPDPARPLVQPDAIPLGGQQHVAGPAADGDDPGSGGGQARRPSRTSPRPKTDPATARAPLPSPSRAGTHGGAQSQ